MVFMPITQERFKKCATHYTYGTAELLSFDGSCVFQKRIKAILLLFFVAGNTLIIRNVGWNIGQNITSCWLLDQLVCWQTNM